MQKPIVIVGEAWGEEEAREGKPFVGSSGKFLKVLLRRVGISLDDCYLTNVFNLRPPGGNDISNLCGPSGEAIPGMPRLANGKYVRAEYAPELSRLHREIENCAPNLVIALGGTASWALCRTSGIKKIRGAPLLSTDGRKVLPTYHPAAVLREYTLMPVLMADLSKAKREALFPEVRRPPREFWLEPTLDDLAAFEPHLFAMQKVSIDIETWQQQITCIGFGDASRAIVVPFCCRQGDGNYWPTLEAEREAWRYVRRWCQLPALGQNFLYDIKYLWSKYGIPVPNPVDDSMLLHHSLQPEMEKGLGFLGSVYTDEPAWKFMRKTATLKTED